MGKMETDNSQPSTSSGVEMSLSKGTKTSRAEYRREFRKRKQLESYQENIKIFKRDFDLNTSLLNPKWQKISDTFFKAIKEGPTHRCYCCDRLWFKRSIRKLSKSQLTSKKLDEEFIQFVFNLDTGDEGQFCKTCYDSIYDKRKIPNLAVKNGFEFPEIPDCLKDLTPLEERLISPRLPFMQIRAIGRTQQYGISGSVVNVPINVDTTVNQLPRNFDEKYTVHVKLKKRLTFKSDYMYECINPNRVFQGINFLQETELFKQLKINTDLEWFKKFQDKSFNLEAVFKECEGEEEDWDEEFDLNPGALHTLIGGGQGICLAPGENQTPRSLLFDDFAEELSFPTIYCGVARCFKGKPTYTQIANSEIRRYDRRAARPDHLFYAYSKFICYRLLNTIGTALRKKKSLDFKVTAENVLDDTFVNNLVNHNDGYKFLKDLKHSPAHWEQEKKRLLCAIRQFGKPPLFVTVSAAETHWSDLMVILSMTVDKKVLTPEEIESMEYQTKCRLIQQDPVTCSLYFDHKFRELKKTWNSIDGPFGKYKIIHSYHRIEFQHRGSPHAHMLLWLENVPEYIENGDNSECIKFIDEIMTCSSQNPYISYQQHKHTFTCKRQDKNGDEHCRFNIPHFPMDKTRILDPFTEEDEERKQPLEDYKNLVQHLSEMEDSDISFDDFLKSIDMSLGDYINTIKSGINRPTVCLRRDVNECMLNNYNPKILNLMQSNMDIQFITNPYACVAYVVDYINKSQRGMSKLLKKCVKECRDGNIGLRDSMKCIANEFVKSSEISAQEAAWSLLELPMSQMSEKDIFIPTFPPGQRARILKAEEKLQNLPKNSTDIFEFSIFDKYMLRPPVLEQLCLADFATWYEFKKDGVEYLALLDCSLYAHKRKKCKILRCVGYQETKDRNEYFREQITLYTTWRDEKADILDQDLESLFNAKKSMIESNRQKYNRLDITQFVEDKSEDEDDEELNFENEEVDCEELDYDLDELNFDIERDMNEYVGKEFSIFKIQKFMSEDDYNLMVRKTNLKQHNLLKHIMLSVIMKPTDPFHIFITGPAGCGKSFLINTITEALGRIFEKRGSDPSSVKIIKTAPTGKAAYNILGLTLHGAFALPTKMPKLLPDLNCSTLNEYRAQYKDLSLIIIDEISMVGYKTFQCVDQRLRQIMGIDKPFGGISVLAFGDFRQLPPVLDSPVYQIPKSHDMHHLSGNTLWNLFEFYQLDEIMRQKDSKFATCLNNLASGTMTDDDVKLLKSREVTDIDSIPQEAIHLFHSNKEVDDFNKRKLLKLDTEGCVVQAIDKAVGIGTQDAKKYMLRQVKKMKRVDTANLSYEISLKLSGKYMLVYNVQTSDGLVNGALGTLKHIEYCPLKGKNRDKMGVKRIWLEFEDESIGRTTRKECMPYMIKNKINLRYTPINRLIKPVYKNKKNNSLGVNRNQFPVVVAEAMTIHKSQGATLNQVAVNIRPGMKRNLLYVAASRATSAGGLHVVGKFEKPEKPSENHPVTKEMDRLKNSRQLIPRYQFLQEREDFNGIQFMYHNIQSLPAHFEDMLADPCFGKCNDLILLAETWTLPMDNFVIPGFEEVVRVDSDRKKRKPSGLIAYVNENVIDKSRVPFIFDKGTVQITMVYILNNIRFVLFYASPQASYDDKMEVIYKTMEDDQDRKTVLVGDFNVNFNSPEGMQMINELQLMDLDIRTNPKHFTTRGYTTIDAVFSNKSMRTGVYMSTYSYHFPLYGRID